MVNWRVLLMSVDECSSAVNTSHATGEPLMNATKAIRLSTNRNIRANSRDWRANPSCAILMPANDANGREWAIEHPRTDERPKSRGSRDGPSIAHDPFATSRAFHGDVAHCVNYRASQSNSRSLRL